MHERVALDAEVVLALGTLIPAGRCESGCAVSCWISLGPGPIRAGVVCVVVISLGREVDRA